MRQYSFPIKSDWLTALRRRSQIKYRCGAHFHKRQFINYSKPLVNTIHILNLWWQVPARGLRYVRGRESFVSTALPIRSRTAPHRRQHRRRGPPSRRPSTIIIFSRRRIARNHPVHDDRRRPHSRDSAPSVYTSRCHTFDCRFRLHSLRLPHCTSTQGCACYLTRTVNSWLPLQFLLTTEIKKQKKTICATVDYTDYKRHSE